MLTVEAALALLRKAAPYLIGIGLAIAAVLYFNHWKHNLIHAAKVEQHEHDLAQYTAAQNAAHVADLEHARTVEAANTAKTKEANDENLAKLADARQRLAAYVRLHPAYTAQRSSGAAGVSSPADSPNSPDRADQRAVVPVADLEACTDAVTRLQVVQEWWRRVK